MSTTKIIGVCTMLLAVTPLSALQFTTSSTHSVGANGDAAIVTSVLDQAVMAIRHVPCIESAGSIVSECADQVVAYYTDDLQSMHWFDVGCQESEEWVEGHHWAYPDDGPSISTQSTDQCPLT